MKIELFWSIWNVGLLLLTTVACQPQTAQDQASSQILGPEPDVHITLIQHDSCPWSYFWCVVESGIHDAAKDLNVDVTISRPNRSNAKPEKVKGLIEETLANTARPDGIGVAITDRELFREPLMRAIRDLGIPVIAYNAGSGPDKDGIPYLTYIGADEYEGGYQSGKRLAEHGGRRGVCINHLPALDNLKSRCDGFSDALQEHGLKADVLETTRSPTQLRHDLKAYYEKHPEVNIFLTLGPETVSALDEFIAEVGLRPNKIARGAFDLSQTILDKIEDRTTLFAVDQQPYLEGYLVVQWLTWRIRHGFTPPAKVISTGPTFVDKSNIRMVKEQVGRYR
jgi:simple sugar transport system substrate-binding protein